MMLLLLLLLLLFVLQAAQRGRWWAWWWWRGAELTPTSHTGSAASHLISCVTRPTSTTKTTCNPGVPVYLLEARRKAGSSAGPSVCSQVLDAAGIVEALGGQAAAAWDRTAGKRAVCYVQCA